MRVDGSNRGAIALELLTAKPREASAEAQRHQGVPEPVDTVSLSNKAQRLIMQLENDKLQTSVATGSSVEDVSTLAGSGGLAKRITTGDGNDTVDLTQVGVGRAALSIDTNAGDDTVNLSFASRVNNVSLTTGAGADTVAVTGMGGGAVLTGAGDDVINAHNSAGTIAGGAGNDTVALSFDSDGPRTARMSKFSNGVDADGNISTRARFVDRVGVTVYGFGKGDGHDTVTTQRSANASEPADIYLNELTSKDVSLSMRDSDLIFTINSTKETLTLKNFDKGAWKQIQFAGEAWDLSDVMAANGIKA